MGLGVGVGVGEGEGQEWEDRADVRRRWRFWEPWLRQGIWGRLSGSLEGLVVTDEYVRGSWTRQSTDRAVGKLRGVVDLIFIPELSCILALPINKAAPPLLQHPFGASIGKCYRIGRALFLNIPPSILSQHHVIIMHYTLAFIKFLS